MSGTHDLAEYPVPADRPGTLQGALLWEAGTEGEIGKHSNELRIRLRIDRRLLKVYISLCKLKQTERVS